MSTNIQSNSPNYTSNSKYPKILIFSLILVIIILIWLFAARHWTIDYNENGTAKCVWEFIAKGPDKDKSQIPGIDYGLYLWDKGLCTRAVQNINNANNKKPEIRSSFKPIPTNSPKPKPKPTPLSENMIEEEEDIGPEDNVETEEVVADVPSYNINNGVETDAVITSLPAAPVINGVWYGYNELLPWQTWDLLNNCEYGNCSRHRRGDERESSEITNNNNITIEQPQTSDPYPSVYTPEQPPLNNPPINSLPSNDLEQQKLTQLINKNTEPRPIQVSQSIDISATPKDIAKGFDKLKKINKQIIKKQYKQFKRESSTYKDKKARKNYKQKLRTSYKQQLATTDTLLNEQKTQALALKGGPIPQKYVSKKEKSHKKKRSRRLSRRTKRKFPEIEPKPVPKTKLRPKSAQEWPEESKTT